MNSEHLLERWSTKRGSQEITETETYYKDRKTELVRALVVDDDDGGGGGGGRTLQNERRERIEIDTIKQDLKGNDMSWEPEEAQKRCDDWRVFDTRWTKNQALSVLLSSAS